MADDRYGPDESPKGTGGDILDDPNNIGAPTIPAPPGGSDLAPDGIIPADGTLNVSLVQPIQITFPVGTRSISADSSSAEIEDISGNVIAGAFTTIDNKITWTPTQSRSFLTLHTLNATGVCIDNDNLPRTWSVSVSFTTLDTGIIIDDPNAIWVLDVSKYPDGYDITAQNALDDWGANGGPDTAYNYGPDGAYRVVVDPFGSGQKVLRVKFSADTGGAGWPGNPCGINIVCPFQIPGHHQELYLAVEMALSPGWISPPSIHMPRLRCDDTYKAGTVIYPHQFSIENQLHGNNDYINETWIRLGKSDYGGPYRDSRDNALSAYLYDQSRYQMGMWSNFADPTHYRSSQLPRVPKEDQAVWEEGVYHTSEVHSRINDDGTTNGIQDSWADGRPSTSRSDSPNYKQVADGNYPRTMQRFQFVLWVGGDARDPGNWIPPATVMGAPAQYMYFKMIKVSTQPITF